MQTLIAQFHAMRFIKLRATGVLYCKSMPILAILQQLSYRLKLNGQFFRPGLVGVDGPSGIMRCVDHVMSTQQSIV